MNLDSPNIPLSIPNTVAVFRLQLTKFSELMDNNENYCFLNYEPGYYCL